MDLETWRTLNLKLRDLSSVLLVMRVGWSRLKKTQDNVHNPNNREVSKWGTRDKRGQPFRVWPVYTSH